MASDASGRGGDFQVIRYDHKERISDFLEGLFNKDQLCDVTICCGEKMIKAHRLVLAHCSTYFLKVSKRDDCLCFVFHQENIFPGIHMHTRKRSPNHLHQGY